MGDKCTKEERCGRRQLLPERKRKRRKCSSSAGKKETVNTQEDGGWKHMFLMCLCLSPPNSLEGEGQFRETSIPFGDISRTIWLASCVP